MRVDWVDFILTGNAQVVAKMAYNGFTNGYDEMDIDASGPKVTVREVRLETSRVPCQLILMSYLRSS